MNNNIPQSYTLYRDVIEWVNSHPHDFSTLYHGYLVQCQKDEIKVKDVQRNIELYQAEHIK